MFHICTKWPLTFSSVFQHFEFSLFINCFLSVLSCTLNILLALCSLRLLHNCVAALPQRSISIWLTLSLALSRSLCMSAVTPGLAAMPSRLLWNAQLHLPQTPFRRPGHSTGTCVINIPMLDIAQTPAQHTQLHVLHANNVEREREKGIEREG